MKKKRLRYCKKPPLPGTLPKQTLLLGADNSINWLKKSTPQHHLDSYQINNSSKLQRFNDISITPTLFPPFSLTKTNCFCFNLNLTSATGWCPPAPPPSNSTEFVCKCVIINYLPSYKKSGSVCFFLRSFVFKKNCFLISSSATPTHTCYLFH